ncbi:hypothetical protein DWV63_06815, partial [Enterococcus durans]
KLSMRHLESSYELVAKLILKDFRVSFLYFFIQKRCWQSSPTSKSIEPLFFERGTKARNDFCLDLLLAYEIVKKRKIR